MKIPPPPDRLFLFFIISFWVNVLVGIGVVISFIIGVVKTSCLN